MPPPPPPRHKGEKWSTVPCMILNCHAKLPPEFLNKKVSGPDFPSDMLQSLGNIKIVLFGDFTP